MTDPARLSDLAPRYDAILCDVWGVIRDGHALIPAAIEALQRYRAGGGHVVLVSNSPRRSASLLNLLDQMSAPDDACDGAVTSGDATHDVLASKAPGPAFKLGPDWDDPIYEGTGLDFAPLGESAFISCTGLLDYETETVDDYQALLAEGVERGLEMVCANPDLVVQVGERLLPCGGALAARYEQLGGTTIYAGKPHAPIYAAARDRLAGIAGGPVDDVRLLAIGDGPGTDIAGANREGIDAMFIAHGILGAELGGGFDAAAVERALAERGVSARWAADTLVW
ncbi:TIGR01459 family HAD-type hydrolase [Marinicauda salina]|uniref:TIGR01459 family HAD-type hydrolase n=1 Tax=Marinicauda salina TaxID=2135793 RepID=A0A2U2BV15_9PROT|nr:TIGR01459 family HAD-type hydrolase [Marinicauda salina]PWE17804.1 TIGR01459 family HAD-type hydrolase [Marinicauda salina]